MRSLSPYLLLIASSQVALTYAATPKLLRPHAPSTRLHQRLSELLIQSQHTSDLPSTLLLLAVIGEDAIQQGTAAPDYNLCTLQWMNNHALCFENKGISRFKMPQLNGFALPGSPADALPRTSRGEVNAQEAFANFVIQELGYAVTDETVLLKNLHATQNEIVGSKVASIWLAIQDPTSAAAQEIWNSALFISEDNYILDGHHRWAALLGDALRRGTVHTATVRVHRIHAPILMLVHEANRFARTWGILPAPGLTAGTSTIS